MLTSSRNLVRRAFVGLIVLLVLLPITQTALADGPLTTRFTADGNYAIVSGGIGMENLDPASFQINIPGTPVQAYLYWSGFDIQTGGDDTVDFAVDGGTPTALTADASFGPDFWFGTFYRFLYVEDVTGLVLSGNHTYTVSNFGPINTRDGAGLIVVYEDPGLPFSRVEIKDGLDNFWEGWTPPRGPNSETNCFDFPAAAAARNMDYTVFVGGVATEADAERPIALWTQAGNGTQPTSLIDQPGATEEDGPPAPYPFFNSDGPEWDTYVNSLPVDAGDTFACLQIESVNDVNNPSAPGNFRGASGVWLAVGGSIPLLQEPPPTEPPPTEPPATEPPPQEPPVTEPPTSPPSTQEPPAESTSPPVTPVAANFSVTDPVLVKSGNVDTARPGDVITWTLVASNNSANPIDGVVVSDPIDPGYASEITNTSTTKGTVNVDGFTVNFNIGVLNPGESVTMTISARVSENTGFDGTCFNVASLFTAGQSAPVPAQASIFCGSFPSRLPDTGYPPAGATPAPASSWPFVAGGILLLGLVVFGARKRMR